MLKRVIRLQNGMVFVFDERGEQVPLYQGRYETVKEDILRDACQGTIFQHVLTTGRLGEVSREEW